MVVRLSVLNVGTTYVSTSDYSLTKKYLGK